jgi:hypothetical protein
MKDGSGMHFKNETCEAFPRWDSHSAQGISNSEFNSIYWATP